MGVTVVGVGMVRLGELLNDSGFCVDVVVNVGAWDVQEGCSVVVVKVVVVVIVEPGHVGWKLVGRLWGSAAVTTRGR